MSRFRPAVKEQLKGRVALCGPTGSGKTWSALEWATVLAEGGNIALIDTEHGSASLYAPHFAFDTLRWDPPYDPAQLTDALKEAQADGYAVVVVDSLSHFWEGEGGTLDVVDSAAQRAHGNSFAGWKIGTPVQRHMVDTLLSLDAHVIVTMRSKMEYVLEQNDKGKQVPRKVGLAPVQRAGVEYEFTIVADIDLEHRIAVTKSRCDVLADQVIQPGRAADAAKTFLLWLGDGESLASDEQRKQIAEALRALPENARAATRDGITAQFGPSKSLTASAVPDVLAMIAAAAPASGETSPPTAPPTPSSLSSEGAAAVPPDGTMSAPITGDGSGTALPPVGAHVAEAGPLAQPTLDVTAPKWTAEEIDKMSDAKLSNAVSKAALEAGEQVAPTIPAQRSQLKRLVGV